MRHTNMSTKVKFIVGILLLGGLIAGSGCAGRQVKIPMDTVQDKVEKKFPIERSVIVAKTKLYKPNVYLEDDKIGIRMNFRASFLKKEVKGRINVRGTVEYDAEKYRFYIADLEIVDVETKKMKLTDFGELKKVVTNLVAKRLEGMVVYKLDTSKRKERYASKRIETVAFDETNDLIIITLGRKR